MFMSYLLYQMNLENKMKENELSLISGIDIDTLEENEMEMEGGDNQDDSHTHLLSSRDQDKKIAALKSHATSSDTVRLDSFAK